MRKREKNDLAVALDLAGVRRESCPVDDRRRPVARKGAIQ
jgi:hypothetical protein